MWTLRVFYRTSCLLKYLVGDERSHVKSSINVVTVGTYVVSKTIVGKYQYVYSWTYIVKGNMSRVKYKSLLSTELLIIESRKNQNPVVAVYAKTDKVWGWTK